MIPSPAIPPPQVSADDYVLQEKLGEGSFGKVFKARHQQTNQTVAIKIIRNNSRDSSEVAQEIAVLKQCCCDNIVRCHAALQAGDDLWLVLECCAGGSLHDIMQAIDCSLTERQISAVFAGALRGVCYLHHQHKIHRDLKAANLLLTAAGEVKLADFGVCAQLGSTMCTPPTLPTNRTHPPLRAIPSECTCGPAAQRSAVP